jgi:hypothetical protein
MSKDIHFKYIPYGFEYGSAEVTRIASCEKKEWVVMQVDTPKNNLQIYVTKTGKVRVWLDHVEMIKGS